MHIFKIALIRVAAPVFHVVLLCAHGRRRNRLRENTRRWVAAFSWPLQILYCARQPAYQVAIIDNPLLMISPNYI